MKKEKDNSFFGLGRRKSASAQVRIKSGTGKFFVNDKEVAIFPRLHLLLSTIDRPNSFNISALVRGGGKTGQEDAIVLGASRAFVELNPDLRSVLRKAGFLTRDPRIKERKKPGLKRARRAPQWQKR